MELNHRQKQILATLKANQDIQIDHLAELFSVTTQTIRRDVNHLCEQGLARRVHGGVSLPTTLTNTSFDSVQVLNLKQKTVLRWRSQTRYLKVQRL